MNSVSIPKNELEEIIKNAIVSTLTEKGSAIIVLESNFQAPLWN
jgi:hypothetical protein